MIYTHFIQRAIKFAIKTHDVYQKQTRKGKQVSYITHPLIVGVILARVGASEKVIAAGILHDTVEDCIAEKRVDENMLAERFGKKVAKIVMSVTEKDRTQPWQVRKEKAVTEIANYSRDSLLVKSADVLGNTSEIVDDYNRYGDQVFDRFSASKNETLKHYIHLIEVILGRWKENPLAGDLRKVSKDMRKIK